MKLKYNHAEVACYLCDRLREPSTWRGLVWIATALGCSFTVEQAHAIIVAGMALTGLIGVFTKT